MYYWDSFTESIQVFIIEKRINRAGIKKRQNKREDYIGQEVKQKNKTDGSQEHNSKIILISLLHYV